jgi:FkbM family methyltransferase
MINKKKKIIIFLCVIIFLIIVLYHKKSVEKFSSNIKNITIGFIIPVTSNKRNYDSVDEIDFFKILLKSLIPTLSNEYQYNFYLGYDDTDKYFNNSKIQGQIINNFKKLSPQNTQIKLIRIVGKKGKLGKIWTILAQYAVSEVDYLYQCGDDIHFIDKNWTQKFVDILRKNNNIGVTGPLDLNNKSLLTQSFVHQTHLKIFNFYFPPNIKNWYIDDWIHNVYSPQYNFWEKNITVKNSGGDPRYTVEYSKDFYQKELENGINTLTDYLNSKVNIEKFSNKLDYVISMFLTGGLNQEAHNCIQTLKKVGIAKNLIVTCLDKKAYDYISKLDVKTVYKKTNLDGDANFGTHKFYNIMINKIEIIKNFLLKYKKCVIYSDTDIIYLQNIDTDINKFIKSNLDIQIQDDANMFVKKPSDNLCAGFMFLKPTKKTYEVLNYILELLNKHKNNYKKLQHRGGADQYALNLAIKEIKPKFDILDTKDYPNGARYFDNYDSIYKNYTPKIIHNNYIIGTKNKIERFKKYNLWFIKNKINEFFTNNISEPYLYGTKYGGFYLPKYITKDFFNTKNIIYYGVGVGQDMSFDLIIGEKFDAEVILIDPTPKAKKHYEKIKKFIETDIYSYNKQEGGGDKKYELIIKNNKIKLKKLKFEYSGLGILNSTQKFYMNKNSEHVSGSFDKSMNFVNKNNYINVNIKTIDSIMKKYNHKTIDILKLDIEGLEISVLNYILDMNILPKIICVDFDSVREGKRKDEFVLLKKKLKSRNYYLYYNDNYDITFIRN